jgi:hypothetical protein
LRFRIETKVDVANPKDDLIVFSSMGASICSSKTMTDQQLTLQAVSEAQSILEEYLRPRPHNNNERILDRLVEVLGRPDLVVAVSRLQQRSSP